MKLIMLLWLIGKKKNNTETEELKNENNNNSTIIYNNISELPSKNILNEEQEMENKILDNSIKHQEIKQETDNKKDDDIINKFGFETIF